ncbi:hypothetical protein D0Y65_031891 [Glycine soja]|uniref:Uncharacterized protein n=1 Tax=Glycine soja TaxID=3848 RepID=A0A445IAJ7_GLYSO|nr:hypothetical protein D0Y65_031891 [Glycine soja]
MNTIDNKIFVLFVFFMVILFHRGLNNCDHVMLKGFLLYYLFVCILYIRDKISYLKYIFLITY